jgi:hypothetical protein
MTEKEKILDEIKIRQKQIAQINMEIPKLWEKYYECNSSETLDRSS